MGSRQAHASPVRSLAPLDRRWTGAIVKTCGSRSLCCGVHGLAVGSFDELAGLEAGSGPAAFEPGPLVTFVRCRTVAKVDSNRYLEPLAGLSWTSLTSIAGP